MFNENSFYTKKTGVYYCLDCNTPIIKEVKIESYESFPKTTKCTLCNKNIKYLSADLRPVFPEERLLFEILAGYSVNKFKDDCIWVNNNDYFINGVKHTLLGKVFKQKDFNSKKIRQKFDERKRLLNNEIFDQNIQKFIKANKNRLSEIEQDAFNYIKATCIDFPNATHKDYNAKKFEKSNVVVSFSGGKDSSVIQDLVIKGLKKSSNQNSEHNTTEPPAIQHIFSDTTLELNTTYEYIKRFKEKNPKIWFREVKNSSSDFYTVAREIGPPARMMRWCCSMFKTGPITRTINTWYPNNTKMLSFYGIRASESVSRSKYNRTENSEDQVKISQQTVAAPIFHWKDIEVWLYLLSNGVDFNDAYRYGYARVGCYLCPNNNDRSACLTRLTMQDEANKWRKFLIDFAKRIGKPDAEDYVDDGFWKARQGGNGLKAANDVKIKMSNCTTEPDASVFDLTQSCIDKNGKILEKFYLLFIPFGNIRENGNEIFIHDLKTCVPIISLIPFGFEQDNQIKIRIMNVDKQTREKLLKQINYQILKFNACRFCLKCESVCKYGAISIKNKKYIIDTKKCKRCKSCIKSSVLTGGCMMTKYLRTRSK